MHAHSTIEPSEEAIQAELQQVLTGKALSKSAANRRLLTYLVQRSLADGEGPKELEIAIDVFGRDASLYGADDSMVRVAMRSLRQKLLEHYTGGGRHDEFVLSIPRGAYRVTATRRTTTNSKERWMASAVTESAGAAPLAALPARVPSRRWRLAALSLLSLLALSLAANLWVWRSQDQRGDRRVRQSALWAPITQSQRPVMFVLGDLFMYTQADANTGHTLTVRDPRINSSDDLRALIARQPALAAGSGLRYSTMLQKSTAISMVEILQILGNRGRQVEVRLRDELRAEDLHRYDIVYVGPVTRLGPLSSDYHMQSRFRFDGANSGITDTVTGKAYHPEGSLGDRHKDYALVARYPGPVGNTIMVFTSGGRSAGLLQVVRTLTTAEGLNQFWRSDGVAVTPPPAFEGLVAVSGYKQTDLSAVLVQMHALSGSKGAVASVR
ncbi:MAG: hypothetical protein ABIP38_01440 [Steroidobacteraceae bacterium]